MLIINLSKSRWKKLCKKMPLTLVLTERPNQLRTRTSGKMLNMFLASTTISKRKDPHNKRPLAKLKIGGSLKNKIVCGSSFHSFKVHRAKTIFKKKGWIKANGAHFSQNFPNKFLRKWEQSFLVINCNCSLCNNHPLPGHCREHPCRNKPLNWDHYK